MHGAAPCSSSAAFIGRTRSATCPRAGTRRVRAPGRVKLRSASARATGGVFSTLASAIACSRVTHEGCASPHLATAGPDEAEFWKAVGRGCHLHGGRPPGGALGRPGHLVMHRALGMSTCSEGCGTISRKRKAPTSALCPVPTSTVWRARIRPSPAAPGPGRLGCRAVVVWFSGQIQTTEYHSNRSSAVRSPGQPRAGEAEFSGWSAPCGCLRASVQVREEAPQPSLF
jgi:hypothetical protein